MNEERFLVKHWPYKIGKIVQLVWKSFLRWKLEADIFSSLKEKGFPLGRVSVLKWEGKPFPSKSVKHFPVGGRKVSHWKREGEMFLSGKGYLFLVGRVNISHTHGKTFPFPVGDSKHLSLRLGNCSASRGVSNLFI